MHKFSLIENALDSLNHAILHLNDSTEIKIGDYKRVILDLAHVAELLFKERLRMIHPAFVFTNIDKYPSQNAHTVSAIDALIRLQKIANVEFNSEDNAALKTIIKIRNEIEHFEFSINENEARVVIGNVLVFLFKFASDEIGLDWTDRRIHDSSWRKLNEFAEFYEAQLSYLNEKLAEGMIQTQDCPLCHNDTFDMDSETCVLCGFQDEVKICDECNTPYIAYEVMNEEAGLCPTCEWEADRLNSILEKD